ncbi:hypothetical protein CYMTET_48349 [Cymbomonas tetramitiformis]|uniref:Uncharacterized protein n=1 Tax=Cymbomonas tetramitiformis TaxID=36881 RepID=A0AAE0EV88_9CHLO|nr:hypothetical protein CYMTET_48349 [Cymbomonas tetramitiformis]
MLRPTCEPVRCLRRGTELELVREGKLNEIQLTHIRLTYKRSFRSCQQKTGSNSSGFKSRFTQQGADALLGTCDLPHAERVEGTLCWIAGEGKDR